MQNKPVKTVQAGLSSKLSKQGSLISANSEPVDGVKIGALGSKSRGARFAYLNGNLSNIEMSKRLALDKNIDLSEAQKIIQRKT